MSFYNTDTFQKMGLFLVLVLAMALRFHGLDERGILDIDEGFYTEGVKSYSTLLSYFIGKWNGSIQVSFPVFFEAHGGVTQLSEKPMFLFMGFLASLGIGVHDYTLLYVSAVFGVLMVLCAYWVGKLAFDNVWVSLVAAFFLSISPLHVAYSRSGFPNIVSAVFAWLAVIFYLRFLREGECRRQWMWGSGFLIGLAFTTHMGLFWLPMMFFAVELVRYRWGNRECMQHETKWDYTIWGLMMLLPLLMWEIIFSAGKWIIFSNASWKSALMRDAGAGTFDTYFENLYQWFAPQSEVLASAFMDPLYYLRLLLGLEGTFLCLLALGGTVGAIFLGREAHNKAGSWLVVMMAYVPLMTYSFMKFGGARHIVVALPAICLLAALGLCKVAQWSARMNRAVAIGAVSGVSAAVVLGIYPCLGEVLKVETGFPQVLQYMRTHEGIKHLSDNMYVSRVYVGRNNAADHFYSLKMAGDREGGRHHISIERLQSFYDQGYRYFVRRPVQPPVFPPYNNELIAVTDGTGLRPVFEAPHPVGFYWPAEICRSERDATIPQQLQVFLLRDVIADLKQKGGEIIQSHNVRALGPVKSAA